MIGRVRAWLRGATEAAALRRELREALYQLGLAVLAERNLRRALEHERDDNRRLRAELERAS